MSGRYLYLIKGRRVGPVEREEMLELIRSRRLGPLDQICHEGEKKWIFIMEEPDLKSALDSLGGEEEESQGPDYVVLVKSEDRKSWVQKGPYSSGQIRKWLRQGWLRYADYAWTAGMRKWQRLGDLQDFGPQRKAVEFEESFPGEKIKVQPSAKGTSKEQEIPPPAVPAPPEPKLPEGESVTPVSKPNLLGSPVDPISFFGPPQAEEEFTDPSADEEEPEEHPRVRRRKKRQTATQRFVTLTFLLTVLFLLLVVVRHRYAELPTEDSMVSEPVATPKREAPPSKSKSKAARPPPEPKKREVSPPPTPSANTKLSKSRKVPTYLRLRFKDMTTDEARLLVETDGSYHYPLALVFKAGFGEVLDDPWIEKIVVRKRKRSEVEGWEIPLQGLKLPDGQYTLTATLDTQAVASSLFLGRKDSDFNKRMKAHMKSMVAKLYEERHRLFQALSRVENWNEDCGNPEKKPLKSCGQRKGDLRRAGSPYVEMSRGSRKKGLLFPALWLELGEIRYDLANNSQANSVSWLESKKSLGKLKRTVIDLQP